MRRDAGERGFHLAAAERGEADRHPVTGPEGGFTDEEFRFDAHNEKIRVFIPASARASCAPIQRPLPLSPAGKRFVEIGEI